MKQLKDILYKVSLTSVAGSTGEEVRSVCFDSRKVENNSLFVAIKGIESNGHDFIDAAIEKGATSIVCEVLPGILKEGITYVTVRSSSEALGLIASNFYDNPSSKLKVVGITGTNGKTTTATLLYHLFLLLGYKVGLLSTVSNHIGKKVLPSTHTTPDALHLNYMLNEMVEAGCSHCFMEVSSHAIEQNRVKGLNFSGAVFSNITHDHLDYHGSFEAYI
ncbi:MAG: Mur ligase family protein, partial [Cyclobacteriaceae bacterium]|nr:Mur ligase family protein [Cyclobacteriaceae bacterium]